MQKQATTLLKKTKQNTARTIAKSRKKNQKKIFLDEVTWRVFPVCQGGVHPSMYIDYQYITTSKLYIIGII